MAFVEIGKKYSFNVIWTALFVMGSVFLLIGITNNALWYDESFCGAMVNHTFADIVKMASGDNHPPFYFILSKILTVIFGNNEFSLRSASLLGVIAIAALGFGPVKRIWGEKAGLLFTLLVFVTPAFVAQALNARMYTWAAFFCTAIVLYAYCAILENKRRDWITFGIFTVLGLYTHVYLMLECFVIYALVFTWLMIKDRKKLLSFVIVTVPVLLLYLPWALVVINQAADVAKEFWIPPPSTPWVLFGSIFMPFQHEFGSSLHPGWIFTACFFCICLLIVGFLNAWKNKNSAGKLFFMCLAVSVLTIAGAYLISVQLKPIFLGRYLTSILGLYILIWVYGILHFKKNISGIIAVFLLIAVFIPQIIDIKTVKRNGPMAEVRNFLNNKTGADDVFVHNDEHSFGIFCYYFPQFRHYLKLKDGFEGYSNYSVFGTAGQAGHSYSDFVKGHNRVWLINRNTSDFSMYPYISYYEFETKGKLYKAAPEKRFELKNSFLDLDIAEFSSDSTNKYSDEALYSGEVKELRIVAEGFRNNKGKALITILNREMYELSEKYLWQNKDVPELEQKVADKLVTNNNFLSGEDKAYLNSFYTLDKSSGIYKLTKKATKDEIEKLLAIVRKMDHSSESTIVDGKAHFVFKGLPKDKYYIMIFHDENGDYQLEMRKNAPPAEGLAFAGTDNRLQGNPTFKTNNIALNKDDMETTMHVYYY